MNFSNCRDCQHWLPVGGMVGLGSCHVRTELPNYFCASDFFECNQYEVRTSGRGFRCPLCRRWEYILGEEGFYRHGEGICVEPEPVVEVTPSWTTGPVPVGAGTGEYFVVVTRGRLRFIAWVENGAFVRSEDGNLHVFDNVMCWMPLPTLPTMPAMNAKGTDHA